MFIRKLQEIYKKKKILSICLERNPDTYVVGFILSLSEKYMLFLNLDLIGREEAIILIPWEQILRYTVDGLYEKKMQILHLFHSKENNFKKNNWNDEELPDTFFKYVEQNNKYIGIYNGNEPIYGKILEYERQWILLQCYNLYGENDGKTVINVDELEVVEMNSPECRMLEILETVNNNSIV